MRFAKAAIITLMATTLVGCNSTEQALTIEPTKPAETQTAAAAPAPSAGANLATQNIAPSTVRMRFAPIIGAPVDKVSPMSRRLSTRAKEKSITIVASTDQTATHVFKGYFSVLGEGANSTVIYVFDVLDPSGNRLHRIQGQESVSGSNTAEPWAAIPATTMETIADKAMGGFTQWLGGANS